MAGIPEIRERLSSYLTSLQLHFEPVGDTIWLVRDLNRGLAHVIVYAEENLVTIRARMFELPTERDGILLEDLLRMNAEMAHGAYAIEENTVIWVDTLEFDTLDLEEFQASLDAASESVTRNSGRLAQYVGGGSDGSF